MNEQNEKLLKLCQDTAKELLLFTPKIREQYVMRLIQFGHEYSRLKKEKESCEQQS